MKKLLFPFFVAVCVCCIPGLVMGADPAKIGIVDLQRCITQSIEGKKFLNELKKKKDGMQKRLDQKQDELTKLKKELEKQSMMLSMNAKEDKAKEFERKRREFKYFVDDISGEMRKAENAAKKIMIGDIQKVVNEIGDKGKYLLIFERRSSGLMSFDDKLDITDEVIKAYDKMKQ